MSAHDAFWFVVGAMSGTAACALSLPIYRRLRERGGGRSGLWGVLGAAALVAATAVCLYSVWGRPGAVDVSAAGSAAAQPVVRAESIEAATQKLAARLNARGGTSADWMLLAQSYEYLGRSSEAAEAQARAAGGAPPPAAGAAGARVRGEVDIDPKLLAKASAGASLFIYAKAIGSPGPPLAVVRTQVGRWPVAFDLSDSQQCCRSVRCRSFTR